MMVRPLSPGLRTRIAAALNDGMTVRATAERFGTSAAKRSGSGRLIGQAADDIVILDNLGSSKGKPARDLIRDASAHLFFLPP